MSYGTDSADRYHQIGVYIGSILKGAKPADLPVVQSTKFLLLELAPSISTWRLAWPGAGADGIEVPPTLLALTDDVIE